MSGYLLDTNVLIYLAAAPGELTRAAHATLADEDNHLFASVVSSYEVGNKYRIGKLPLAPDVLASAARRFGVIFEPLTDAVSTAASLLDWTHRDPWDRIIAAQAIASDATLISSDQAFDALEGVTRLW